MSVLKNVLKNFQMSEQYWGCSDKMSEANFSPAETLYLSIQLRCCNKDKTEIFSQTSDTQKLVMI